MKLVGAATASLGVPAKALGSEISPGGGAADRVVIHPFPEGMPENKLFRIRVRPPRGSWQNLMPYSLHVSNVKFGRASIEETAVASFDFEETAEIEITYQGDPIRDFRVRPLSLSIHPENSGNTLRFQLTAPANLSIEINGDIFHNLHLFAGRPEVSSPAPGAANVRYFGPGAHHLTEEQSHVKSGETVYLSGGAVVHGAFLLDHVENVRILGRGLLYKLDGVSKVRFSRSVEIEGIVTNCNLQIDQSEQVTIRNTRSVRAGKWGDGIDVFCSKNVTIDHAFLRTSDDCIAIYGHRWEYDGDTTDVSISNCVLWADVAHPVLIGTHGNSAKPNTIERIRLDNLDILDQHEEQVDYQGCIAINTGDSNLVRDVEVANVRVEDFRQGQLVNLRVMFNAKFNTSPGRGIEDVVFRNLSYNGSHANLSIISGYDDSRAIKNVRFENLVLNGTVVWDGMQDKPAWYKTGDIAGIYVGEHVKGLSFIAAQPK